MQVGNLLKIESQSIKVRAGNLPVLKYKFADVRQENQQFRLPIARLSR